MALLLEPIPIDPDDPNAAFLYYSQLQQLFSAAKQLRFTQRGGSIQQGDKAGNFSAVWVVFTSNGVANTEDAVTHTLSRVPVGFLQGVPNKAAQIYDSGTTWTSTKIYVKTSVATVAWKLLVF